MASQPQPQPHSQHQSKSQPHTPIPKRPLQPNPHQTINPSSKPAYERILSTTESGPSTRAQEETLREVDFYPAQQFLEPDVWGRMRESPLAVKSTTASTGGTAAADEQRPEGLAEREAEFGEMAVRRRREVRRG